MRINLGSGWRPVAGYTNVDLHYAADVKADLREVAFPAGSASEVLAIHVIEHLERPDAVALFGRVFEWLKPGGRVVIEMPERSRCLSLDGLAGLKGLMGGRSIDKPAWHRWLKENAAAVRAGTAVVPEKWRLPGEAHLWIWDEQELADVLDGIGFEARTDRPQFHGGRNDRDCRWEAVRCV